MKLMRSRISSNKMSNVSVTRCSGRVFSVISPLWRNTGSLVLDTEIIIMLTLTISIRFPIVINEAEPAVHLAVKAHAPNLIQFEGWVHRFRDMDKYMRQKGYGAHAVGYFKVYLHTKNLTPFLAFSNIMSVERDLNWLFALCLSQRFSPAGFAFPTYNFGCALMGDIFLDQDLVQNCVS